jgi:hypothetical protein
MKHALQFTWLAYLACCLLILCGLSSQLHAQDTGWGLHKRMFAVPVPKKVVIDGKLGEWDMSGALTVYVMAATKEVQSGRVAVMYNADALYLGGEVRDPSPLMNRHSPEAEGDFAWDADSFQFRLVLDPKAGYPVNATTWDRTKNEQLVHLLLWNYTDRQEPNLQLVSGMTGALLPGAEKFGVMPKKSFNGVYRLAEDKRGYTFEYRIPWTTLGAKQPLHGGDVVAATMQFNWGRPDGLKTAGISAWGYDLMAYPGFPYQNAGCWGKLIIAKTGNLPRDLVDEGMPPEKPLPLSFEYDLPEEGQVSLTLFNAQHEAVRTLAAAAPRLGGHMVEKWDGLDTLNQPLPPGAYTWKGLYHQPLTTKHVLSVHNSGQPAWKTDDNTGGWGGDHGAPSGICAAGDDLVMAWNAAEAGWGVIRTNGEGKKRWGILHSVTDVATDGTRIFAVEGNEVRCYDLKDGRPIPYGNGAAYLAPPDGDPKTHGIGGVAFSNGSVFSSYPARNMIAVYDAKSGAFQRALTLPVPGALAARPDGSLVAISDGKLVLIVDGAVTPLATEHLDTPAGLALAADAIYVANTGTLQNISVFTPAGQFLRSIGKAGGRPAIGRFDPAGMLQPRGMALDTKGRLWVMECIDSPKRVSVWEPKTGTLVKEFFGDAHYSSFIWMDPEHPDEVYCDGTLWTIDLDKKTSYPKSTAWRQRDPNMPGDLSTHGGGLHIFTAKNGRQYGYASDSKHSSVLFIRDGDAYTPLLAFLSGHGIGGWKEESIPYPAVAPTFRDPDLNRKYPWGTTVPWVDANGDGMMQPGEIGAPLSPLAVQNFASVDRDLNLWTHNGVVFRPLRIEANGRPVYDFTKAETVKYPCQVVGPDVDDGSVCLLTDNPPGGVKQIGFGRCAPDGTLLWGYRGTVAWFHALNLPPQSPGKIWGQTAFLGTAGDFTGFATYFGCHHIYTRDGVCVGMVFRDPRLGGGLGADIIASENYNGQLVKPKEMNRYFTLGGDQDGRITEIFGLDTVKRLPGGTVTITAEDAQRVTQANADYQAKLAKGQRLVLVRGRKALETAQAVSKIANAGQAFQARAAYDEKNLYVQFTVTSPAALVNGITDPQLLFKGGNCLDIQLAADPKADAKREKPAVGDQRLLVSRQNGKTIAVLYRPVVKDFAGQPIVFRTANVESFDSIATIDAVTLDYLQTTTGSFNVVATIPLSVLNWQPQPGTKVKMDLGFIFGNNEGTKAMVRSYWSNNGFSAGVLNDVPNESKLTPKEWGMAEVE